MQHVYATNVGKGDVTDKITFEKNIKNLKRTLSILRKA